MVVGDGWAVASPPEHGHQESEVGRAAWRQGSRRSAHTEGESGAGEMEERSRACGERAKPLLTPAETASTRKGKRRRAAFTFGASPGALAAGFLPAASLVRRLSRLDLPGQYLFFLSWFFFFK